MTSIAIREAVDESTGELVTVTALGQWAQGARQAAAVAQSLANTPFVPQSLRERPTSRDADEVERAHRITVGNITATILTGDELGLQPMAALRSIDVIQGTPAMRAIALRAIVLAAGHDMWVEDATETRAIVKGKRKGSDQVQQSVWTLDRAQKLGLAGKENWRKQPGAMLVARATSECARLVAADAILGVPYSVEELADGDEDAGQPVATQPAAAAPRTARRRTTTAPQAIARPPVEQQDEPVDVEPDFDEVEPVATPETAAVDPINPAQVKKVQVLYRELDVDDRDERLADVGAFVGRDVLSTSDLTKDEASRLIDDLERRVSGMTPDEAALFTGEPS